jgi:hypothetical protein
MIETTRIIFDAYAFVWHERFRFAWLTLPAVLGLMLAHLFLSSIALLSLGLSQATAAILLDCLVFLLASQFAVAWHRHQLISAEPVRLRDTYRFGHRQGRFIIMGLGIYLLLSPIFISAYYFSYYVAEIFVDQKSASFQSVTWLISLPLLLPIGLVVARVSLLFPAAAIDRPLSLRACWQLTNGYGWQLFFLLLFAWGPAGLFSMDAALISGYLARVGVHSAPDILVNLFSFVDHILFFIGTAVVVTVLSITYRTLVPELATAPQMPPLEKQKSISIWTLLGNAFITGLILGGAVFIAGFFGPLFLASAGNLAPLAGFLYAPIGFVAGFIQGLLWNVWKARKGGISWKKLAIILAVILIVGAGMSQFFVVQLLRMELAMVLPDSVRWLAAPKGVLQIWAFGVPPENRQHFLDKTLPTYVGGPMSSLGGAWKVSFYEPDALLEAFMQARQQGREPDVLVGEDRAPIEAIFQSEDIRARMPEVLGNFSYRAMGKTAFINRDSPNFGLARKLAWGDIYCDNSLMTGTQSPYLETQLKDLSVELATASVTGDIAKLRRYSSQWQMGLNKASGVTIGPSRFESVKFCGAWGSSALAFAKVIVNFEAEQFLGRTELALAFHMEQDGWRLLAISREPTTIRSINLTASRLEPALLNKQVYPVMPEAAVLKEPSQYVPAPDSKKRSGWLIWDPSGSSNVVAEVAEIACRSRDYDNIEHDDVQFIVHLRERHIKPVYYVPAQNACPSGWPWKWRVWSVTGDGISFSNEQTISN